MASARIRGMGDRQKQSDLSVGVSDLQKVLRISTVRLEQLVRRALVSEGISRAEIGVVLVDDVRIAALHKQWLNKSGPTDVLTFNLSDSTRDAPLQGDIVVSTETARSCSRRFGSTPRQELIFYVIHGLLHLTGYDDTTPAQSRAMRARERSLMRAIGLPCPQRNRTTRGTLA